MILTEQGVIHYLLFRGLIDGNDALSHHTTIQRKSSRNRNFIVSRKNKPGYFIKQSGNFFSEQTQTLRSEANCYWLANNDELFAPLKPILCKYYDYNPQYNILILQSVPDSFDMHRMMMENQNIDIFIAEEMANALSAMHNITFTKIKSSKAGSLFSKFIPWVFKIEKGKTAVLNVTSPATKELVDLVNQHTNYIELINKNKDDWEINCLIHGDIKFANFLIDKNNTHHKLKLIDLEICDMGDACWDVAGVLQSFLTWWIEFAGAENKKLDTMQPSIKHFWNIYTKNMATIFTDKNGLLNKCMNYAAIRMIQTSYEAASSQQQLMPNQLKTLQMSLNILLKPQQAAKDLLSIE